MDLLLISIVILLIISIYLCMYKKEGNDNSNDIYNNLNLIPRPAEDYKRW